MVGCLYKITDTEKNPYCSATDTTKALNYR